MRYISHRGKYEPTLYRKEKTNSSRMRIPRRMANPSIMCFTDSISKIDNASRQAAFILLPVDFQKSKSHFLHLGDSLFSVALNPKSRCIIHAIWVVTPNNLDQFVSTKMTMQFRKNLKKMLKQLFQFKKNLL